MPALDIAAFFLPLVFIAVLWAWRARLRRHPVALVALALLTVVGILHFNAGMLASDPYHDALRDIGAPRRTWTASVLVLLALSFSGEVRDALREEPRAQRRRRGPQTGRTARR